MSDIPIRRRSSRILLISTAALFSFWLAFAALQQWLVVHWENEDNPRAWARAARFEPSDAKMWWAVAIHYERDPVYRSLPKAEECLQHAVHLVPSWYLYWDELGKVQEELGKASQARQAYERAEADAPQSASAAWEYGSFLLRQGQPAAAAQQVRRALLRKVAFTGSAVQEFWRSGAGISTIVNQVLPPQRQTYLTTIGFFLTQQQDDDALACWKKLASLHLTVKLQQALPLIDDLIADSRIEDAHQVWMQALAASNSPERASAAGSLIFNGNFEYGLVNGGFGWRQTPIPGAAFDLVTDVTHGSSQSARVSFNGHHNLDYANLFQDVAVEPGSRYRFSAFMRTEDISTDTGPQFVIYRCADPGASLAETPPMTGTHPWTKVQLDLTTGSSTDCIKVVLSRRPSQLFSNRIRGMVWVDDVRLVKYAPRGTPGERFVRGKPVGKKSH